MNTTKSNSPSAVSREIAALIGQLTGAEQKAISRTYQTTWKVVEIHARGLATPTMSALPRLRDLLASIKNEIAHRKEN